MQIFCALLLAVVGADDDKDRYALNRAVLVLETSAREIEVGEPLFVKTTILNGGKEDLWFRTKFSSATGLLRLDVRAADGSWTETIAEGQGGISYVDGRMKVPAKTSFCAYSTIFSVGGRLLFDNPGEMHVRARVKGEGFELASSGVPLTVRTARREQYELLSSNDSVLGYLWPEAGGTVIDDVKPIVFDRVPKGRIRNYLEGHQLTADWVRAPNGTLASERAEKRVLDFVKTLDPVMKEEYLIALSIRYVKQERFRDALATMDRLPDPSATTIWLRKEIAKKAPELEGGIK